MCVVAFQSIAAMADSNTVHQITESHLQTEHDHHLDTKNTVNSASEADGHHIKDCHHCGHCSGTHISWVNSSISPSLDEGLTTHNFNWIKHQSKGYYAPLLRPPIA